MDKRIFSSIGLGFVVLLLLLTAWKGFYTVDEGERGVILRNGAISGVAEPGLSFKVPFVDAVKYISVQSQTRSYADVLSYSKDQQTANIAISVSYRLPTDQIEEIYSSYGSADGLLTRSLDPKVFKAVKEVFGQFTAVSAIQDRGRLGVEVMAAIKASVTGPIIIDSIQIENMDFSDAYENSIEQRMLAEVDVQKIQQTAAKAKIEAEITVTNAMAQADSTLANARAQADATRLQGEAEADAIRAKGDALRDNPALIGLTQAERWNGVLPTTMVPDGAVPFLDVNPVQ